MKRNTVVAFVLGTALGTGVTYLIMRDEVRRAVAEATEQVGKTVKDMGRQVEKAGRQLQVPENKNKK